jgi:hypothetical protein
MEGVFESLTGSKPIIRMKIKRKRRNAGGILAASQHTFANVVALAKWITDNISDEQKQQKLMREGIRNAYTITVTMIDRSEKVSRLTKTL